MTTDASSDAAGLTIDGHFVGRTSDLDQLRRAAVAASEGIPGQLVTVVGDPGYGKTTLLHRFAADAPVTAVGYGYYDGLRAKPYAGIAFALGQLVSYLRGQPDDVYEAWASDVDVRLGSSAEALTALVPDLEVVLGSREQVAVPDVEATKQRLHQGVVSLLESIVDATGSAALIVDDLHWAGPASIEMLRTVHDSKIRGLLVVAAWRTGQSETADRELSGGERLVVGKLNRQEIAAWLTEVIGSDPNRAVVDKTDELTHGNPLYLAELTRRSLRDGTLGRDPVTGEWRWDQNRLNEQQVSDEFATFLAQSFKRLQAGHSGVLAAAACLDTDFDLEDAIAASGASPDLVADAIKAGLDHRLLVSPDTSQPVVEADHRYRFAHDRIADAGRSQLTASDRKEIRLRIGRALSQSQRDERIFDIVRHLSAGADLIESDEEIVEFARLADTAGSEARRQAAFSMALSYYYSGYQALVSRPTPLGTPSLRSRLAVGAAEAKWLVSPRGGDQELDQLLGSAKRHADNDIDRARVAYLQMKVSLGSNDPGRALKEGKAALAALGIKLPRWPSQATVLTSVLAMSRKLKPYTDDDIKALPICTDEGIIEAQSIMSELISTAYAVQPNLFPHVILRAVGLTLDKGRLPISPVAFAAYGLLMIALGRYKDAERYGELAKQMAEDPICLEFRPWTHFMYYDFLHHWHHPLTEGLAPLRAAQREGVQVGDLEYAGYMASAELGQSFYSGMPFDQIDERGEVLRASIHTQQKQVEITEITQQLVRNLQGTEGDPLVLAGSTGYDERVIVPRAERVELADGKVVDDKVLLGVHWYTKLLAAFYTANFEEAQEYAKLTNKYKAGLLGTVLVPMTVFCTALSAAAVTPGTKARSALSKANKQFDTWAKLAPSNFDAPSKILRGEAARQAGDTRTAEQLFMEAIDAAEDSENLLFGAVANELTAMVYAQTGRERAGRPFLEAAIEQWSALGNNVRLEQLSERHEWIREALDQRTDERGIEKDDAEDTSHSELVSAALSVDSARRALLLVADGDGFHVIDSSDAPSEDEERLNDSDVASTLIRFAARADEPIWINDLSSSAYQRDPYLSQAREVRSAAAIPVEIRDGVVAVLYVERATPGKVDRRIRDDLERAAAATGIELAREAVTRDLDSERAVRISLEESQARLVPRQYLEALGADDLADLEHGKPIEREMTVLFTDIEGYTSLTETLPPEEAYAIQLAFLNVVEPAIVGHGGFVQDIRGDEVMALFENGPENAIAAALDIVRARNRLNEERSGDGLDPLSWGIGIHHGDVVLAPVGGVSRMNTGVMGDTVNVASHVQQLTREFNAEILVTEEAKAAASSGRTDLELLGSAPAKTREESVRVYAVVADRP